jgi:hypothetical protein
LLFCAESCFILHYCFRGGIYGTVYAGIPSWYLVPSLSFESSSMLLCTVT